MKNVFRHLPPKCHLDRCKYRTNNTEIWVWKKQLIWRCSRKVLGFNASAESHALHLTSNVLRKQIKKVADNQTKTSSLGESWFLAVHSTPLQVYNEKSETGTRTLSSVQSRHNLFSGLACPSKWSQLCGVDTTAIECVLAWWTQWKGISIGPTANRALVPVGGWLR